MVNRTFFIGIMMSLCFTFCIRPMCEAANLIHGCFKIESGKLRVLTGGEQCLDSESPILLYGESIDQYEFTVDCEAGETVAGALAKAPSLGRVTITIDGVCQESVTISRDEVTLQGAVQEDGLELQSATSNVLRLDGARGIRLQRLTIRGGNAGIEANRGATFDAFSVSVIGAVDGIGVSNNAVGTLTDVTVKDNSWRGLSTWSGGAVFVRGNLIDNNPWGVQAGSASFIELSDTTIKDSSVWGVFASGGAINLQNDIVENNGVGVWAHGGGTVGIAGSGTFIRSNNSFGVGAMNGSTLTIQDGVNIVDNLDHGVFLSGGSAGQLGDATVQDNEGNGVTAVGGSSITIIDGAVIKGNANDGVYLMDTSMASFGGGTKQIVDNGGYGIDCHAAPSVAQISGNIGTVSGNTLGQINCPQN